MLKNLAHIGNFEGGSCEREFLLGLVLSENGSNSATGYSFEIGAMAQGKGAAVTQVSHKRALFSHFYGLPSACRSAVVIGSHFRITE